MTILYYLPEKPDNFDPRQGPLSYAFEDKPMGRRVVDHGPDGSSGSIFVAAGSDLSVLGHFPDRQVWSEVRALGCWIGYFKDREINEESLRRRQFLDGNAVRLGGVDWTIPMARSFDQVDGKWFPVCVLPTYLAVDYETLEWKNGEVAREYRALWEMALRYWEIWWRGFIGDSDGAELEDIPSEPLDIAPRELESMTVTALSTNYRVGRAEISLLNLLQSHDCQRVLNEVIDLGSLAELVKKNRSQPESCDTDNGEKDDSQPTHQLSLTG